MARIRKVCNMAILLTSILVFGLWQLTSEVSFYFEDQIPQLLSFFVRFIISYICSYGLFNLMLSIFSETLSKSSGIKEKVLCEGYIEGTWAVFYYMYGELRLSLETFTQDLVSIQCSGVGRSQSGNDLGSFVICNIYWDEKRKELIGAYEDDSAGPQSQLPGYSHYYLDYSDGKTKSPAQKLHGSFFELGMKKQIRCVGHRLTLDESSREDCVAYCFEKYGEGAAIHLSADKNSKTDVWGELAKKY